MLTLVVVAESRGEVEFITELLYGGADVNAQDVGQGKTALFEACHRGYADIVELLIQHGANVNLATKSGEMPIRQAIITMRLATVWGMTTQRESTTRTVTQIA